MLVAAASTAGIMLLGLAGLLVAEGLKLDPKTKASFFDYLPGLVGVASWIFYVQRPKTVAQMRWNCVHLVFLAAALVVVAYALKPSHIVVILLYWSLAVITSKGVPLLVAVAIIATHQVACSKAAAEFSAASRPPLQP